MAQNEPLNTHYLDQIASSVTPKKAISPIMLWLIIGGAIVLLLISFAGINALLNSGDNKYERLVARLTATQTINDDATTKLKSSSLRGLNVSLKTQLTTTLRDIESPLQKFKVNLKSINKDITASEQPTQALEELEAARLNGQFDTTFARTMSYQLTTVLILVEEIHSKSSDQSLKAVLETTYDNLLILQKEFEGFSSINT